MRASADAVEHVWDVVSSDLINLCVASKSRVDNMHDDASLGKGEYAHAHSYYDDDDAKSENDKSRWKVDPLMVASLTMIGTGVGLVIWCFLHKQ